MIDLNSRKFESLLLKINVNQGVELHLTNSLTADYGLMVCPIGGDITVRTASNERSLVNDGVSASGMAVAMLERFSVTAEQWGEKTGLPFPKVPEQCSKPTTQVKVRSQGKSETVMYHR